jgi:hypothetical protein
MAICAQGVVLVTISNRVCLFISKYLFSVQYVIGTSTKG